MRALIGLPYGNGLFRPSPAGVCLCRLKSVSDPFLQEYLHIVKSLCFIPPRKASVREPAWPFRCGNGFRV